jgi:hypothetical protein
MGNSFHTEWGSPLGFHDGNFIYDLQGRFVGQLHGSQVYCMAGHYVGELEDGVIHDNRRNHGRIGPRGANSKVSRARSRKSPA